MNIKTDKIFGHTITIKREGNGNGVFVVKVTNGGSVTPYTGTSQYPTLADAEAYYNIAVYQLSLAKYEFPYE